GLDLPAPGAVTLVNDFALAQSMFPTASIALTTFSTMEFSGDLDSVELCDKDWDDLLGDLEDFRGDSENLVYGILPGGVPRGVTGGCGRPGVAAGPAGAQRTLAHEMGHAFGRRHAPCDSELRCRNPKNPDSDYPRYAPFPSDSIGEFGFDPTTNTVFAPNDTFDVMGYSRNRWISPYTYMAMYGHLVPDTLRADDAPAAGVKVPRLFLRVEVARDRTVRVRPSFTFAAALRRQSGTDPQFTAEIVDGDGHVIACQPLDCPCFTCGPDCWPRKLCAEIPFEPQHAKKLRIYERGERIHEAAFQAPPKLRCDKAKPLPNGGFELSWRVTPRRAELFLVQWLDRSGTWRGLGPRTTATTATVPAALLAGRRTLPVRVLATNGLSTSSCTFELDGTPDAPAFEIVTAESGGMLRAWAIDATGRMLPETRVRWFAESGTALSAGNELDLSRADLPPVVRAVVSELPADVAEARFTTRKEK
ncbi:MAG TPA: hypothetical protein VEU30_05000, partial [Thermoanaerobaculia bacterium]|nr:hypothetical protein [Thermoanaerobaculia bacterium]